MPAQCWSPVQWHCHVLGNWKPQFREYLFPRSWLLVSTLWVFSSQNHHTVDLHSENTNWVVASGYRRYQDWGQSFTSSFYSCSAVGLQASHFPFLITSQALFSQSRPWNSEGWYGLLQPWEVGMDFIGNEMEIPVLPICTSLPCYSGQTYDCSTVLRPWEISVSFCCSNGQLKCWSRFMNELEVWFHSAAAAINRILIVSRKRLLDCQWIQQGLCWGFLSENFWNPLDFFRKCSLAEMQSNWIMWFSWHLWFDCEGFLCVWCRGVVVPLAYLGL